MYSKHAWVLSVLDDIRDYARENDLPIIADVMQKNRKVLKWEIDSVTPIAEGSFANSSSSSSFAQ